MSLNPVEYYVDDYDRLQGKLKENWFSEQRDSALKLFKASGFPTTRQENWKYTDVRPLAKKQFVSSSDERVTITKDELDAIRFNNLDSIDLVFINGIFLLCDFF